MTINRLEKILTTQEMEALFNHAKRFGLSLEEYIERITKFE